ncbi:MAG TPA: type III-A CRISPR-associated protein Csm2 [Candidatus Cloacimonetes bacterium]|nr:type III-A CRISPR-associated protein Csm2 [Candidatus Cloacimonadota bacterium]
MHKGKVTNFHPKSGAGFIKSEDFEESVYCHKKFVDKERLGVNDQVEFEVEEGPQGFKVTTINKIKKLSPLLKMALIINELSVEEYNNFCNECKKFVSKKNFKDNVSTSKLRNLFSEVLKINNKPIDEKVKALAMLRPKLAYYSGREPKVSFFMEQLDSMISEIKEPNEVENFKEFFEAIVCYKKDAGGKE